jgi:hypothetical protein
MRTSANELGNQQEAQSCHSRCHFPNGRSLLLPRDVRRLLTDSRRRETHRMFTLAASSGDIEIGYVTEPPIEAVPPLGEQVLP